MIKKLSIFLLGLGLLALPLSALAEVTPEGFYVGGDLGLTLPGHTYLDIEYRKAGEIPMGGELKSGFMFTGGLKFGYAFGLDRLVSPRAELAVNYGRGRTKLSLSGIEPGSENDFYLSMLDDQTISYWSVMANAIFDINIGRKFYPYVGAGFGLLYLRPSFELEAEGRSLGSVDATISRIQAQLILGGGYNLNQHVGFFGEFRLSASSGLSAEGELMLSPRRPQGAEPMLEALELQSASSDSGSVNLLLRPGIAISFGVRYSF